jgi:hypothetical protein
MWEFVTSRGTCSDHRVPTSFTRTEPPLNQFSRLVMLGLWPGGEIPCLADDLSAIGWDQVALTVTRPNGAARRLLPRLCRRRRGRTRWRAPARQHRNREDTHL